MNAPFGKPAVLAIAAAGALVMPPFRGLSRAATGGAVTATPPAPSIAYTLRIDLSHVDVVDVAIRLDHAPRSVRLAMKVHPEYDAQYWRYLEAPRVEGSPGDASPRISREDSTVWRVTLPAGRGTVHYRVHIQPARRPVRAAWGAFVTPTGALLNSPDVFLYVPDLAGVPVTLDLFAPPEWRIATSLAPRGSPTEVSAPDAAALLDAPVLLGDLRTWAFRDRGTTFHVVYWPLPQATPFDTVAFVDEVRRLVGATLDVFGRAPTSDYFFLVQDGAGGALEHGASVTIGIPSAALARDARASLTELAHEFFHTWNLVAIHPDHYGELSYEPPRRTTGLWWGEGVTMHYADVLARRAGLGDGKRSRLDHLADVLKSYYAAAWSGRVSPERASLAVGDSPLTHPDATGAYYLQGELLGEEIDALVRDATHDARGLDDVMRALFGRSVGGEGFTSATLEAVIDSVCGCRLDQMFALQVRGSALIDLAPVVERLGLKLDRRRAHRDRWARGHKLWRSPARARSSAARRHDESGDRARRGRAAAAGRRDGVPRASRPLQRCTGADPRCPAASRALARRLVGVFGDGTLKGRPSGANRHPKTKRKAWAGPLGAGDCASGSAPFRDADHRGKASLHFLIGYRANTASSSRRAQPSIRILVFATRRLHDAVQRNELGDNELSHLSLPAIDANRSAAHGYVERSYPELTSQVQRLPRGGAPARLAASRAAT